MAVLYLAGDYLMNFLTLVTVGRDCLDRLSYRFQADFSINMKLVFRDVSLMQCMGSD